jgi:predicted O-methyltransferase YrrM
VPKRIPHIDLEVLAGEKKAEDYLAMQERLGRFYLRGFLEILARQNRSGRFLEVGTGPGYQTAVIATAYPETEIVGLEPSADMVKIATTYTEDRGLGDRTSFVEGVVEDEALVSSLGEFELVYSTFSLHHWADPVRAVRNIYEALSTGGVLVIFDFERRWLQYYFMPGPRGMRESIKAAYTRTEIGAMMAELGIPTFDVKRRFPYMTVIAEKE